MKALELADTLFEEPVKTTKLLDMHIDAAAMIRRQHDAIVKLREALQKCNQIVPSYYYAHAESVQVLKDTEDLV